MHKVGKWLQKLMSVALLIAGQPARGVEFLSCAIRNTPAQIRGVYFVDGLAMLLSLYGKADNLRGSQRPVARFLCKDTSFLLINYLTYVREMEVVASEVLYKADQTTLYNQLLAVKEGRALLSRDLSEGISRIFLAHFKIALPLNSWRHMAIAWTHRFLKHTKDPELACNGSLDSQAGHSQQTASKVYGRSNFDHPSIGRDEFQLYRLASVEWHKLLHLASDSLPPSQALVNQSCVGATSITTTSTVHHHHHHAIKVVRSVGDVGMDLPSQACSELVLSGLLELGYSKFKSSYQARAIHRILDRQEDLLVVLPTSGGKTLLFLLPAMVERGRYTTVVICPFVALKKEMQHCLENARLSIQVYSESVAVGAVDILLVSVEHCLLQAFQNHLGYLHGEGRLARIVVDECHLALVASSWRSAVRDLEHVRKVPVPLLLLSATVPPNMEDPLKQFFNSQLSVVRSPTTRSNITYHVMKDHGPLDTTLVKLLTLGPTTPKSIIFCRGREDTRILAALLRSHGLAAVYYHGHLDEKSKSAAQDSWMRGDADIMVATGAFGVGINFGAVRLIVHMDEPYSMIDLAQESGRGGRDGLPSKHIILLPMSWQARAETCTKLVEFMSGFKCRRWVLQDYVDGCGLDCFSSGSECCDVCQSMATRVQSTKMAATSSITTTNLVDDDMDLFADMDEDALARLEERPTKKICLGNALLFGSTYNAQERHASLLLTLLDLVQFLKRAKDKCILCIINLQHECHHFILQCPYAQSLCFKCLANWHGSSNCPNRLQWKGKQCFSCGLPNILGQQVMHPERFGPACNSIGQDKVVPACWYFWRNSERFRRILETSGCLLCINDHEFSDWLTSPNAEHQSNAIYLLTLYVSSLQ